jgi:hypothetical protein
MQYLTILKVLLGPILLLQGQQTKRTALRLPLRTFLKKFHNEVTQAGIRGLATANDQIMVRKKV